MQEMKLGTGNILEQSLSPYHTGERIGLIKEEILGTFFFYKFFVSTLGWGKSSFSYFKKK